MINFFGVWLMQQRVKYDNICYIIDFVLFVRTFVALVYKISNRGLNQKYFRLLPDMSEPYKL